MSLSTKQLPLWTNADWHCCFFTGVSRSTSSRRPPLLGASAAPNVSLHCTCLGRGMLTVPDKTSSRRRLGDKAVYRTPGPRSTTCRILRATPSSTSISVPRLECPSKARIGASVNYVLVNRSWVTPAHQCCTPPPVPSLRLPMATRPRRPPSTRSRRPQPVDLPASTRPIDSDTSPNKISTIQSSLMPTRVVHLQHRSEHPREPHEVDDDATSCRYCSLAAVLAHTQDTENIPSPFKTINMPSLRWPSLLLLAFGKLREYRHLGICGSLGRKSAYYVLAWIFLLSAAGSNVCNDHGGGLLDGISLLCVRRTLRCNGNGWCRSRVLVGGHCSLSMCA